MTYNVWYNSHFVKWAGSHKEKSESSMGVTPTTLCTIVGCSYNLLCILLGSEKVNASNVMMRENSCTVYKLSTISSFKTKVFKYFLELDRK